MYTMFIIPSLFVLLYITLKQKPEPYTELIAKIDKMTYELDDDSIIALLKEYALNLALYRSTKNNLIWNLNNIDKYGNKLDMLNAFIGVHVESLREHIVKISELEKELKNKNIII